MPKIRPGGTRQSNTSEVKQKVSPGERLRGYQIQPGEVRNPTGRPIGSRNKLCTAFLEDLQSIWTDEGKAILRKVAQEHPAQLMNAVASLVPKQVEIDIEQAIYVIRDQSLSADEWAREYAGATSAPSVGTSTRPAGSLN